MRRFGGILGLALVLSAALPRAADAATIERTYPVGNEPFGVTIDPSDGRIYVANSDHGSNNPGFLSVVDPMSPPCSPSACGESIALVSPPVMSALDRGLGRLFVTTANRTLTFIDVAMQSVVNEIPNAGGMGVAIDESTHYVYASSRTSVSMVDGITGSVPHTAPAGPDDDWWAVSLDTSARRVYVTNLDPSAPSLVILHADDLSFIDEVPLPERPRLALTVDIARQLVYVGGYSSAGLLYVIDANSREITRTIDLQAGSFPFSATLVTTQDRLYLSHGSLLGPNSVVVLDLATLEVIQRIPLPWEPGATALHANGRLYVAGFSADLLAEIVLNSAPFIDDVALSSAAPQTNDTLRAVVTASDADGDSIRYTFTWKVNGAVRATETGPNASSSFDLALAGKGDRDDEVTVEVVASDGMLDSAVASASVGVANSAPTVSVALSDSTPASRDVLVATVTAQDADQDPLTLTYAWSVNGVTRQSGAANTFDLAPKGNGDNEDVITVIVIATDGDASATAGASATVTPGRKK